ncbi:MAG: MFS transporter [Chromatiales bacterium]|jgi:MFS family permease|nr:MFS transporter [Chromatiales bacterium]
MAGGYVDFLRTNWRFAGFGAFMAFSSSFGQTYFIGIFGPSIQMEFGLSHTAWGMIYMVGTLGSAFVLPHTGKFIDSVDLRLYAFIASIALVVACLGISVVIGPLTLAFAIFGLRQAGQGLSSHVAQTAMARYFDETRGRAIAFTALGFALAEAALPAAAVAMVAWVGWRSTYQWSALLHLLVFIPILQWLLVGHGTRHRAYLERQAARQRSSSGPGIGWSRAEVIRDLRFYLLLPGVFAPSLVLTALFFHHLTVADAKGWSHAWMTGSYVVYSFAAVLTSLIAGPVIDRIGAIRLVPLMLIPLAGALVILGLSEDRWMLWPYLALCGVATGITYTAVSAMWAELYGLAHLGSIRSFAVALGVFGSALGPVIMGALMDAGLSISAVAYIFAVYVTLGAIMLQAGVRWRS